MAQGALPNTGSAFGYDLLSYNYHLAAAAAAATQQQQQQHQSSFNGSTHSLSGKSDRSSGGSRERRDSYSKDIKGAYPNQVDHDKPPFSRIFVVCSKSYSSDDLKAVFEKYGAVEDVWVVRDKHTKENRGVAYVKFSKMSEACLAVESMDGKKINNEDDTKSIKVYLTRQLYLKAERIDMMSFVLISSTAKKSVCLLSVRLSFHKRYIWLFFA